MRTEKLSGTYFALKQTVLKIETFTPEDINVKSQNLLLSLVAVSALLSVAAQAQDRPYSMTANTTEDDCQKACVASKEHTSPFSGGGSVNLDLNTGNTNVRTYGATAFMDYKAEVLNTRLNAGFMQNLTDDIEKVRRIDGSLRTGFNVINNIDFFGLGTYMQNRFKGIESQVTVGPGIGIYLVNNADVSVRVEGSPGFMWESYNPTFIADRSFMIGTAGAGMRFKLSDVADISDNFSYIVPFATTSDWRINNVAAITSSLTKHMALKLSYTVEYRNTPVYLRQYTDSFTTAAVVVKL